jgi:anti-sigma regulatory factor (Ser/Thr protein kinase)
MPLISVADPVDVLHAQTSVRRFSAEHGFDRFACQELAIVASELASNIIKYGERGEILAHVLMSPRGPCLELIARDYGPQFHNLESAMKDGWDQDGPIDPVVLLKRSGIGGGLGAILRFTHSFSVEELSHGKRIITRRYLNEALASAKKSPAS